MSEPFVVAHITDLHIGAHSDQAWSALSKTLSELSPSLIIISGDITDSNEDHNFRFFLNWLKGAISPNDSTTAHGLRFGEEFSNKTFIVPGNHDYFLNQYVSLQTERSNYYKVFLQEHLPKWRYIDGEDRPGIFLLGLDSSKSMSVAKGEVDKSDLESIREWSDQGRRGLLMKDGHHLGLSKITSRAEAIKRFNEAYKILVLHHYLFLPKSRGNEPYMILQNNHEVLAQITTDDFDMVVSGHDHQNVFDDPKYDNLLDQRAIRRFARMYCIRQFGVRRPPVYYTDQNLHLVKRSWRCAIDYIRKGYESFEDTVLPGIYRFDGQTIDQKLIKRGRKDFVIFDLSDLRLKGIVQKVASMIEREIRDVLQRRTMIQCIAPSATKSGEECNGFFIYKFHRDRRIDVEPYLLSQDESQFVRESGSKKSYILSRPIDLFHSKVYQELEKSGAVPGIYE
ncbi:MAG: metallophosphoesterase [Methylobacter sp.]